MSNQIQKKILQSKQPCGLRLNCKLAGDVQQCKPKKYFKNLFFSLKQGILIYTHKPWNLRSDQPKNKPENSDTHLKNRREKKLKLFLFLSIITLKKQN
jgi:hypothetical protein